MLCLFQLLRLLPNSYTVDLCSAVPYFDMDKDTRDNIWDDGLHLTKEGYEMMGDAIASRMIELLKD